ncbi:MAG: branched-chain amino acid ABC transporter permease [Chloroflexota bacterium]
MFRGRWDFAAIALGLVLLLALPFLLNPYYTSIAIFVGIYTIVTVGLCLLMGYTGQVSLGQAAFYGLGAYISAILSKSYGVSPWLAMAIAALVTGGFAYIVGVPILKLKGNYLAMATLGLGIITYIVFREAEHFTGGQTGLPGIPYLSVFGFVFNTDKKYYYLVWAFCLAILLISQNIVNSRTGRALKAIRDSEIAAESIGIDVAKLKVKVFSLSAVYASLAGSLYVHYITYISPQPFDFLFSVRLLVMAAVGGLASIWGAIFGTATVSLLGETLHSVGELETIAFGFVLMVTVIFLPRGLWVSLVGWLKEKKYYTEGKRR